MEFWVLWFIGIVITIGTRIAINRLTSWDEGSNNYYIDAKSKPIQVIMHALVIICIILVGGIINGVWLGSFAGDERIWIYIVMAILPAMLTYIVGFHILGLRHFLSDVSQICFILVFIISIIGWTIPICKYNRNIEKTTEATITATQERKLLYFCNIPLQEISGKVSGASVLGIGDVSGNISTLDKLPYWYANENGEGKYSSANANSSKIVFIPDEEKPYLKIISYCNYTKTVNHNNGKEKYVKTDNEWKEYIFYLPQSIMQYSLY